MTKTVSGLAAGGSLRLAARTSRGSSRLKYLVVAVDAANTVAEDDENNNLRSRRF